MNVDRIVVNEGSCVRVRGDRVTRSARGVYGISVAAELSGIDPQTLRLYERRGLLTPARTEGGTRRYSEDDLDRLQRISALVADGVNIAGIAQILSLQDRNTELASTNSHLARENARLRSGGGAHRRPDGAPVTITDDQRPEFRDDGLQRRKYLQRDTRFLSY